MINNYIKDISDIVLKMGNLLLEKEETLENIKEHYINNSSEEQLIHSSETGGKLAPGSMFESKEFDYFDKALEKIKELA